MENEASNYDENTEMTTMRTQKKELKNQIKKRFTVHIGEQHLIIKSTRITVKINFK